MFIRIGARPDHDFDRPLGLLSDCHRRIEHFLGVIARVVAARGGPLTDQQQADLDAALRYFAVAAPRHTADEEESLFPRLRACGDAAAVAAMQTIERLERDHADAGARHAAVDALVRQWIADGALSPAAQADLQVHVTALQAMYREHIAIEDREVFPAAARLLPQEQIADIGAEMAARRGLRAKP